MFRTFSLSSASLCLTYADIDVGVTLWVGVFLDWPFSEAVQSDVGLTADPRLCLACVQPRPISPSSKKREASAMSTDGSKRRWMLYVSEHASLSESA